MLTLTLLRHAKSSWDDPDLDDHERQLTKRGTKAARRMGHHIAERGLLPDLILCSDAIRARATLALVLAAFDVSAPPVVITPDLYLATPDRIMQVVAKHAGDARHVLVIGHSPGLHALALSLPAQATAGSLSEIAMKFPTAALAQLTFDVATWSDVRPATGTLVHYVTPRTLPA